MMDWKSTIVLLFISLLLVFGSYQTFLKAYVKSAALETSSTVETFSNSSYTHISHDGKIVEKFSNSSYTYISHDGKIHKSELMFPLQYATESLEFTNYVDIHTVNHSNFDFVTGASSNHFKESRDMVASIQNNFPQKKIYYYDLGLNKAQLKTLATWCSVIVRKFDFSRYPPHVHKLANYAFKPIIIHEMLHEVETVFWADASIRFITNDTNAWDGVYDAANITGGIVQFSNSGWLTFQCTHHGMYRYLTADEDKLKTYAMLESGSVLYYRTEIIMKQVIHWHRLCALTEQCIQPKGHNIHCTPKMRKKAGVSSCHRYDQSALNILTANMLDYNWTSLISTGKRVIGINRKPTKGYQTRVC